MQISRKQRKCSKSTFFNNTRGYLSAGLAVFDKWRFRSILAVTASGVLNGARPLAKCLASGPLSRLYCAPTKPPLGLTNEIVP